MQLLHFKRSEKTSVVLKYTDAMKRGTCNTYYQASLISHKFDKAELGLASESDSSGMIHSKTSVRKQDIYFFSNVWELSPL